MDKTIENASDIEVQEDEIIVLGVASIETKGIPSSGNEAMGFTVGSGMTDE